MKSVVDDMKLNQCLFAGHLSVVITIYIASTCADMHVWYTCTRTWHTCTSNCSVAFLSISCTKHHIITKWVHNGFIVCYYSSWHGCSFLLHPFLLGSIYSCKKHCSCLCIHTISLCGQMWWQRTDVQEADTGSISHHQNRHSLNKTRNLNIILQVHVTTNGLWGGGR